MSENTINSDLIRGHIDTIILKALYESDRYGYDIIKEIEQKTDGQYRLKQPTLYSCLKRLEDQGFTSSYWGAKSLGGRKKYYTLTELGKQLLLKNHSDWEKSRSIIDKLVLDGISSSSINSTIVNPIDVQSNTIAAIKDDTAKDEYWQNEENIKAFNSPAPASTDLINENDNSNPNPIEGIEGINNGSDNFYNVPFQNFDDNFDFSSNNIDLAEQNKDLNQRLSQIRSIRQKEDEQLNSNTNEIENGARELLASEKNIDPDKPDVNLPSTYELSPDSNTLTAVTISNDPGVTDSNPKQIFANENVVPPTQSDMENANDINKPYMPSYIEGVSKTVYGKPSKASKFDGTKFDDDELPYDEHVKQQYGENTSFEVGGSTSDDENPILNCESKFNSNLTDTKIDHSSTGIFNKLGTDISNSKDETTNNQKDSLGYDVNELKSENNLSNDDNSSTKHDFIRYDSKSNAAVTDEEIINREYNFVLSKLIRKVLKKQENKPKYSEDAFIQKKLDNIKQSTLHLGDKPSIRKPNDSIKEYTAENFYFCNKLKLLHYFILFIIMLVETIVIFVFAEINLHNAVVSSTDAKIYILGVLAAFALPITAAFLAYKDFNKRKKIEFDFKTVFGFRMVLTLLLCLIVALINVYLKITTKPFNQHIALFVYPMVMLSNIVVSIFIFKPLLYSKRFNCK